MINRREKDQDKLDPKTEGKFQSEDEQDEEHFYTFDWPNILAKINAPSNDNPISYREFMLSHHYASVRDHARVKAMYRKQASSKKMNSSFGNEENNVVSQNLVVEDRTSDEVTDQQLPKKKKSPKYGELESPEEKLANHNKEVKKRLYGHNLIRRLTGNPSFSGGIAAYTYLQKELTQEEREAFAKKYTTTFTKVMENLPVEFLDQENSGFVSGILDSGFEQEKLLEILEDPKTWDDPALLRLVLSMVFQAYDKPQGISNESVMPKCKKTLNTFFKEQYVLFQTNEPVKAVLEQFHISSEGYVPIKVESQQKEYNFIRMLRGGVKTLNDADEHRGVALSFIGLTSWMTRKRPELKGFALDDFQRYAGGALGGVQFGDGKNAGSAKLDFKADFKAGSAQIDSDNLPFQNINYLSDSFAFKTDEGYFKNIHADFDWPAKNENADGLGKISVSMEDMMMSNLRIIFPDETYGLSKIQLKGVSITIYQNFGQHKDMNTSSELLDKFIAVFYDLSQFITYAIQLCVHRFSNTTGEDAGKNLNDVLARALLDHVGMNLHFDSLDIENLLLIDNDFPAGKTIYPVDASQEYVHGIHLGKTDLAIQSKIAMPQIGAYETIKQLRDQAKTENRPLTVEEQATIDAQQVIIKQEGDKNKENDKLRRELSLLTSQNEEEGETDARNKRIADIKQQLSVNHAGDNTFHLSFDTEQLQFNDPQMLNKIVKGQASGLADNTNINTPDGQNAASIQHTHFETDFTTQGLSNTHLTIANLVIPDITTSAVHYKSEDELTTLKGGFTHLTNITADLDIFFKDEDPLHPEKLIEHIDISSAKIGKATIQGLTFKKSTPGKKDTDPVSVQTLTTPADKQTEISGLVLEGWKIRWDDHEKMHGSMMDQSMKSSLVLDEFKLPEGSHFGQEEGDASSIVAGAMTDISVHGIRFAALKNPESKAIDKTDYTYSFDQMTGLVALGNTSTNAKGTSTAQANLNLNGLQLSEGLYYKESLTDDVVQFKLNKIDITSFDWQSPKLRIESPTPAALNTIALSAHIHYRMKSDKPEERDGIDQIMLDDFSIQQILSKTISVSNRKDASSPWQKMIHIPGETEGSMGGLFVRGLGYNFDTKKFVVGKDMLVASGLFNNTDPALVFPFLSAYFGKKFAGDFNTLRVETLRLHGEEGSSMVTLDVNGVTLKDLAIKQLNVGGGGMRISSSGKPAHLKTIAADVSIDFDINGDSKAQTINIKKLRIAKAQLYGLKIKMGSSTVIDLQPSQQSTIDDIRINDLKLITDATGKNKVDYSKTVASTGKIDLADLSVKIGESLSLETGVEASSLTFNGKGDTFELTLADPEMDGPTGKTGITGKAGTAITLGQLGDGTMLKGKSLVAKKGTDGKISYALKEPEIKGLKLDFPDKGVHLIIDANIAGGELDATDTMVDFGGTKAKAWLLTATENMNVTGIDISIDDLDKLKSASTTAQAGQTANKPYSYLDKANGTLNLSMWGHPIPAKLTNGMIDFTSILTDVAAAARQQINSKANIDQETVEYFRDVLKWALALEQWQINFMTRVINNPQTALGLSFEAMLLGNSQIEHDLSTQKYRIEVNDVMNNLLFEMDLVDDDAGNYVIKSNHATFKASALIDCIGRDFQAALKRKDTRNQTSHASFLAKYSISQTEFDRRKDLPWHDPQQTDDVLRNLDYTVYPDEDQLTSFISPWVGKHAMEALQNGLNFSFGGSIQNINLEQLVAGTTYKDPTTQGISIDFASTSTEKNIVISNINVPGFTWLNEKASMKLDTNGINLHINSGVQLQGKTVHLKPDGVIQKPTFAIKK